MTDPKNHAPAPKGRRVKNDILFIAALLVLSTLFGAVFFLCRNEGSLVKVSVDGEEMTYPLSVDREVLLGEGDKTNLLIIKDGEAWVAEATCRDGICAAHRPISKEGESIVCLPHKTVVTVE